MKGKWFLAGALTLGLATAGPALARGPHGGTPGSGYNPGGYSYQYNRQYNYQESQSGQKAYKYQYRYQNQNQQQNSSTSQDQRNQYRIGQEQGKYSDGTQPRPQNGAEPGYRGEKADTE